MIQIITGKSHVDERGCLQFNNDFNLSAVKRMYTIENNEQIVRGWQGHKIEQRWFACMHGKIQIEAIKIDNWQKPNKHLLKQVFELDDSKLHILHVPGGYVTRIRNLENPSKLLVFADYNLGELDNDEYRFDVNYFK